MNVLADRHHAGLWESLELLAKRLGWTLYTPKGLLWYSSGVWNFGRYHWGDDRLAQQFLNPDQPDHDPEFPDRKINLISLPEALEIEWDLVIATVEDNQLGFYQFAKEHNARYAVHVGNTNQRIETAFNPLILNASEAPGGVHIGEEFDSDGLFRYCDPVRRLTPEPWVASFVNCFNSMATWPLFEEAKALASDINWSVYGIDGPDGVLKPIARLAGTMAANDWAWHDKEHGDGFGHVLHYWAAIGRPLIGHGHHYAGKNGHRYWRDLETCIDLDKHSVAEAVEIIRTITPEKHAEMCRAIRAEFDRETDWAADAADVAAALAMVPA
jgi:hypothetical protein